jgi:predicted AlkP superfamily pyrophosphatase or phosphodiesterase
MGLSCRRLVGPLAGIGLSLLAGLTSLAGARDETAKPERPRLAVLVVFDQMRGEYLTRWQELFIDDGFKRLQREGAWFENCHYPYANTMTAAGHASLATGCSPDRHGIIGNDWYDRSAAAVVGAVDSDRDQPVPPPLDPSAKVRGSAPLWRRQPTVGDALHKATAGKAKVVSLSIKDRAAILLAALRAQICYWFSTHAGAFVTSTHYRDRLHPWVAEFNERHLPERWFGSDWTRLRPKLDYARFSGPDDVPAEGDGYKQGRTFPHPTTGGLSKAGKAFYGALTNTPYGNELLLAFAKRAIEAERLGQGETPDLLLLSFSSNDLIGHVWGPDSQEVLDVTLRSDLIVKGLLDYLDAKVGRGRYLLVLSADHGVCPLPEVARAEGKDAGRVWPDVLVSDASAYLNETFAKNGEKLVWFEAAVTPWLYLNRGAVRSLGLEVAQVEETLARWLAKQPGIQAAFTRTRLSAGPIKDDPVAERVRLSFDSERSGDVYVLVKPYYLLSPPLSPKLAYRTTHGTPHLYDTHVPLLVYGPGVRPGIRRDAVTPQAAAAILARGLGIELPPGANVRVPQGLWKWPPDACGGAPQGHTALTCLFARLLNSSHGLTDRRPPCPCDAYPALLCLP